MAPQIVYVCTTKQGGQHLRASGHCGVHNHRTDAACGSCGEQLWDGGHRCQ